MNVLWCSSSKAHQTQQDKSSISRSLCSLPDQIKRQVAVSSWLANANTLMSQTRVEQSSPPLMAPELILDRSRMWGASASEPPPYICTLAYVCLHMYERACSHLDAHQLGARLLSLRRDEQRRHSGRRSAPINHRKGRLMKSLRTGESFISNIHFSQRLFHRNTFRGGSKAQRLPRLARVKFDKQNVALI